MSQTPSTPGKSTPPFTQPPTGSTPSGGLASRFGAKTLGELLPLGDTLVIFDLASVADALPQAAEPPSQDARDEFIRALRSDAALTESLKADLDAEWQGLGLHGAVLVYAWRDDVRQVIDARLRAIGAPQIVVRSLDPLLVLNVLARSRTALLLPHAPPALEEAYLTRVLVSDDPRLVELARARSFQHDPTHPPEPERTPPQEAAG